MAVSSTKKQTNYTKRSWLWVGIASIIALIIGGFTFIFLLMIYGYAADALGPIESALTKEGATKACSRGDDGLGPDNRKPWANAYYQVPGNMQQATDIVRRAASAAGYTLTVDNPNVY